MDQDGSKTDGVFRGTQVRDDGTGPVLLEHRQRLLVVDGPERGLELEVPRTTLTIGSAEGNDLVLRDGTVSRRHCVIALEGERHVVRDLGSTNGTLVDGTPVREAYLAPGARLRLGDSEIVFRPRKRWERIEPSNADHFGALYGATEAMRAVFSLLAKIAPTDLGCILVGETGTGKELAARALHEHSHRAEHELVVVDCGAIHGTLIESELFGHERGAFTGAERQRIGAFEAAHGGTVFLDEIGELPLELQPKLLRVLERREIKRLGSARSLEVDVRVIAATHRDLPAMVREGRFREDLYYRLAEVVVSLPPLRERKGDLPLVAERMLAQMTPAGMPPRKLSADALEMLSRHDWPGNVRELRNVLRRAVAMTNAPVLTSADLQLDVSAPLREAGSKEGAQESAPDVADELPLKEARERWVAPLEREYLERILRRSGGDLDQAARAAGIHRKSLERLLRQHGLRAANYRR